MGKRTADPAEVAGDRLRAFVERLERLDEEKRDVAEQIADVMREAKGDGFDTKTLRAVLKRRRTKPADLAEQEELLAIYEAALGQLRDTPLGAAALRIVRDPAHPDYVSTVLAATA